MKANISLVIPHEELMQIIEKEITKRGFKVSASSGDFWLETSNRNPQDIYVRAELENNYDMTK